MFAYEEKYLSLGYKIIAGMDEAGRGPLAGPVVCACAIMPLDKESIIKGVDDSKKLSALVRERLYKLITKKAIDYSVSIIDYKTIDEINILNATKLGMENCVRSLKQVPQILLVDAVKGLKVNCETLPIIHGDALSYSIAAASIIAKVTRDKLMTEIDSKYPLYQFAKHKGYGTALHIKLLKEYGPCEIHRRTFITHFV